MPLWLRHFGNALKNAYRDVLKNHTMAFAAALSYYFVLSLFPLLIALAAVVGSLQPHPRRHGPRGSASEHGSGAQDRGQRDIAIEREVADRWLDRDALVGVERLRFHDRGVECRLRRAGDQAVLEDAVAGLPDDLRYRRPDGDRAVRVDRWPKLWELAG